MRTEDNAASSVASGETPEQIHYDALFRNSKTKIVDPPQLPEDAQIADTHAHLDMLHHPELALARAAIHGVNLIITVVDPTEDPTFTFKNINNWLTEAAELLKSWSSDQTGDNTGSKTGNSPGDSPLSPPEVRIIIGCHPHNASKYSQDIEDIITDAVQNNPRVVGIGEIGLDYFYDNSPRDIQRQVFARQIQLAHQYKTRIALHLRDAHPDGIQILQDNGLPKQGTLLHCFNLDYATLEPFLDLDCYIAYGGPLTFKKSDYVRDAASRTPLNRVVTETDSPFMAPHPLRGTVCGPEDTVFTAALLADLQTQSSQSPSPDQALTQIYKNALNFFNL
jgi:TatD DNase family protein